MRKRFHVSFLPENESVGTWKIMFSLKGVKGGPPTNSKKLQKNK